jgi:release factor glutamine methyltransferase
MTFNEARVSIWKQLDAVYDPEEAKNVADLLLEHVTGLTRAGQLSVKKNYLTCTQLESLDSIIDRLKKNEPVQYVLGEAWFAGLKFKVNPHVLIPRPETEELVDWVTKELENEKREKAELKLIDIGTGSGCIPVTLKKKLPHSEVTAVEVCSETIFTATENALVHQTGINFILLDFLNETCWNQLGKYDVIISNPPYIKKNEESSMHERVKGFEPGLALFVPDDDALMFYRKLVDFSKTHLQPGGSLFVEINESLGEDVVNLFRSKGFEKTELKKDMQGKDRMVKAGGISST